MKDLCEQIFCFWKKWCKEKNSHSKKVPIESTKMILKIKDNNDILYSKISTPSPDEKNIFKFKESDSSTILTIVEIIFPKNYLNNIESSPSFNFEFTRERIISFIEDEIKINTKYVSLVNQNGFDIYINESGSIFNSEFPMIKMYYKIPKTVFNKKDISVKTIDKYMNDPEKRLKWDKSIREYKIIERQNNEVYLLHYICKSPMIFVSERDIVDKRYDFYVNDIYYDFSSSANDDFVPIDEDIVRMTDHCSVCKIYEENNNFNIISITQVDSKYKLPKAMLSIQLPVKYKEWYDSLINAINEESK